MRVLLIPLLLVGCSKSDGASMPPATEWQTGDTGDIPSMPRMPSNDPHGGMASNDPHAGMMGGAVADDPHAGVPGAPPLQGNFGGDPNAAHGGTGVDVTQLGMQSPDPNRPVDPNRRIRGTIKITKDVAPRAAPGAVLYLMVRKLPDAGQPQGTLIAVDKLKWSADGQAFELTERNAMVQGAPDMLGELVLMARIDGDEDALTREPGDVVGQINVKVPADNVVVTLDSVIP